MPHFVNHFEENYLKAIFKLSSKEIKKVNNTALAKYMELNPATVLEMVRKMGERDLVQLLPDKTIKLTDKGERMALSIIRRHRLWEVFLVKKLKFKWNEVHALAEQLEHIESDELVDRLEEYLGFPACDPHGDPIPNKNGVIQAGASMPLLECKKGTSYIVRSFAETADTFLDYLSKVNIYPGSRIKVTDFNEYDQSCTVQVAKIPLQLSEKVARNILVQPA